MRRNDPAAPWLLPRMNESGEWSEDAWRMWHQKEPRELLQQKYELPKKVYAVGEADRIYYSSDKWEEDGDFYTYYHDFESRPTVYIPQKNGRGKDYLDVVETLEMEHINDSVRLPLLAKTLELIVDVDGEKESRKFRGNTPLCCTSDLKTLVVFAGDGPIIIRGGEMVVTERGIVR
jgi:hypothetical protein